MEKRNSTIVTAPELPNQAASFAKFRTLPGKNTATADEFYAFITKPSIERDRFLATCECSPVITAENVLRQKFL